MYKRYLENTNIEKTIDKLSKNKDRVVFYGAGLLAEEIFNLYDFSPLNIIGISDKKFEKTNTSSSFCNIKTIKPSDLHTFDFDVLFITVLEAKSLKKALENEQFYQNIKKRNIKVINLKNNYKHFWNLLTGINKKQKCIICNHTKLKSFYALVAPFLNHLMFDNKHKSTNLLYCPNCKTAYFELRPNEIQAKNYYKDYASEEFFNLRKEFEPNILEVLNMPYTVVDRRKSFVKNISCIKKSWDKFEKIMDYGGGGAFFEGLFSNAERFCYNFSEEQNESLNSRINTDNSFDFISCSQVLEHTAFPRDIMEDIYKKLKIGGYAYISVPNEKGLTNDVSFIRRLNEIGKPFVMHEHINIFQKKSLEILMKITGFKIIKCENVKLPKEHSYKGFMYIIVQK